MKQVRNFIIVLLGMGIVALGVYVFSIREMNMVRAARAETLGSRYISQVYTDYKIGGKICQGVDTDNDGYVTCTFRVVRDTEDKEVILKCPTYIASFFGTDCKSGAMIMQN